MAAVGRPVGIFGAALEAAAAEVVKGRGILDRARPIGLMLAEAATAGARGILEEEVGVLRDKAEEAAEELTGLPVETKVPPVVRRSSVTSIPEQELAVDRAEEEEEEEEEERDMPTLTGERGHTSFRELQTEQGGQR
jgi:hypothetical protein